MRGCWILKYLHLFLSALNKDNVNQRTMAQPAPALPESWLAPPPSVFKVNVDATWKDNPPSTDLGATLRDSNGLLNGVWTRAIDLDFAPPLAELLAIQGAL